MKRHLSQFVIGLGFLFSTHYALAADTYKFDPNHSFVEWRIDHLGYSMPSGKWPVEGTLVLDEAKPENSKVNVTIRIAKVITGVPKLDEHLQAPLFFDAGKFPTATFVSNKVILSNKTSAKVTGTLTVKGISKPVVLDITLNKIAESPISNKMTAGFSGKTTLKRSDFDMTGLLSAGLGDEVKIDIEAEAQK